MCKYVAILIYQGLVESVDVFNDKRKAGAWVSKLADEYGPENCADSIIWDVAENGTIEIGFVH
jgi:hypothetical protein